VANLINISEAASLALHAAAVLAGCDDAPMPTSEIASELRVSEAHLAKVLQRLSRAGLVKGTRGPGGGFRLTRDPSRTTLLSIYEAVEGPVEVRRCLFDRPVCGRKRCPLGSIVRDAGEVIAKGLEETTLDEISTD
jgi:Rrf2 family protein